MKKTVSLVTGVLAYDIMCNVANMIKSIAPDIKINVYPIVNNFFGEKITVTGLLTGRDMVAQLSGKELGDAVILPDSTLKADEEIFLDDMTLDEFQSALQVPVIIVQSSGRELFERIIESEKKDE